MGAAVSAKLLFIGLDGSGKTTCLNFLDEGPQLEDTKPSVGFDTKDVKVKGVQFSIYDVAGGEKVRDLWKHYYEDTDAVVWFVDSSKPERFQESAQALELALKDPSMRKDLPLLVAANKCDVEGAKSEDEIKEAMNLKHLLEGRKWTIIKTNAKMGEGVHEGFKWLSTEVKADFKKQKKAKH